MHPVTMLMEEIYRDYWGIPSEGRARHYREDEPGQRLRRYANRFRRSKEQSDK